MSRAASILASALLAVSTLVFLSQPAAAHERRMVGPYQLVVGWIVEPAFAGELNAVDLRVTDTRTTPARAVEGLEKTVSVEVFYGGLTTGFKPPLRTRFGLPGSYAADLVATRDGAYKFRFSGRIESQDLNETFESGPGRFNDMQPIAALQYPPLPGGDASRQLEDIRSATDQTRLAAIAAIVLGVISIALALRSHRA